MAVSKPVMLGAYPAIRCPVRTHYRFDPSVVAVSVPNSPELQQIIDAGNAFEEALFEYVLAAAPDRVHLVDAHGGSAVLETADAMERGVPLILRAALPDDEEGKRVGRPDLLVRHGDSWPAKYVPGDVKLHKFLEPKASNKRFSYEVVVAPASDPSARSVIADARPRGTRHEDDALQLAHYTRMLEALGRHPGPEHYEAFLVSGDEWDDWGKDAVHGTWIRLDEPAFSTYSRTEGSKKRSALERYDHEFSFRLTVAENAAAAKPALVVPIYTSECETCDWYAQCERTFAADPTASFTSWRPSLREWLALRTLGITDVDDLAALELNDEWLERYVAEAGATSNWRKRLDLTIERAKVASAGHTLVYRSAASQGPRVADVEIDLDMENDTSDRVFLWGARLRRGENVSFHAFVRWDVLDDAAELALADELTDWLAAQRDSAQSDGESIAIFHHGHVEKQRLRKIQGQGAVEAIGIEFVDTHRWAETNMVTTRAFALKPLATSLGFEWRDEDPGGRNCQLWLDRARETSDAAERATLQQRILDYNEDDTAATAWIRDHAADLPYLDSL
ncbi:TM0106 family RecB-like putative nuclease [Yimella sp. cx-51]|uniref:TM0106 family RecB-like putative nuclease n=1 Tax=Yimella sp. cx-51 TaxID=2770551 RepID=UPI00165DA1A2|nr:TM0106 family RecB-like putative nuclease [Yimella sp. cx-51]MBC9958406.1 TM0106 family RecB-like putative nuclease [Yimella sp. cx-51]QTH38189.1 TM0106 family RecB-like putative nuclease [Yimella sp. cx-51]